MDNSIDVSAEDKSGTGKAKGPTRVSIIIK